MQIGPSATSDPSIDRTSLETAVRLSGQAGPGINLPALLPAAGVSEDSVSLLLQQLATPDIADLISGIVMERASLNAPGVAELMGSAVAAVGAYDLRQALDIIRELAVRHPDELPKLSTEPAFAPIRGDVEDLVQRHMVTARTEAELKLSLASHSFETFGPRMTPEVDVAQVLSLAQQLLETDRYGNVLLAGDLGQYVINFYARATAASQNGGLPGWKGSPRWGVPESSNPGALDLIFNQVILSMANIAERVPAKLLLFWWLVIGAMSGLLSAILYSYFEVEVFIASLPFEIWGGGSIGFLGLSGYRRMQKARAEG